MQLGYRPLQDPQRNGARCRAVSFRYPLEIITGTRSYRNLRSFHSISLPARSAETRYTRALSCIRAALVSAILFEKSPRGWSPALAMRHGGKPGADKPGNFLNDKSTWSGVAGASELVAETLIAAIEPPSVAPLISKSAIWPAKLSH